jgi:SOS response regulatory protein OraA/RecX
MAPPKPLAAAALFDYAVAALARRSLTVAELRSRLEHRAARPQDIHEVIHRLRQAGYLDDAQLAESYARFRRDYEGLGRLRILRDLERRGVDSKLAENSAPRSSAVSAAAPPICRSTTANNSRPCFARC